MSHGLIILCILAAFLLLSIVGWCMVRAGTLGEDDPTEDFLVRCGCCEVVPGPSEAHEIEQGMWWTSIPLCPDCHQGAFNGIHGQKRIWKVMKKDEMSVLNDTIRLLMED